MENGGHSGCSGRLGGLAYNSSSFYHHPRYNDLLTIKLTTLKFSGRALATANSWGRVPRAGRVDVGTTKIGVDTAKVEIGMGGRRGVCEMRNGVFSDGRNLREGIGSCKDSESENRDDFELHLVFFVILDNGD